MDLSEVEDRPAGSPAGGGDGGDPYEQCDQCGAAVAGSQRYCVVCGAHLKRADDPAARYLGRVAGARTGARSQRQARPAARGRGLGLGSALVLALIPVAAAIGVLAGRASNNDDAKLIHALARRQPAVTVSGAAPAAASGAAAAATGSARHKAAGARAHSSTTSTAGGSKAPGNGTTSNGTVHRITGFKASKSEEQQGAQATQQVQKETGKSYVNSQKSLPSQVVVP